MTNDPDGRTGATSVGRDGGDKKWLAWLLGLLVIAALVIGAFFLFDDDSDDPNDVDVDVPAVDVTTPDVDAPDVDVDAPDVDVDPDGTDG